MTAETGAVTPQASRAEMVTFAQMTAAFALLYAACISFYYRSWTFGLANADGPLVASLLNVGIGAASLILVALMALRVSFRGLPWTLAGVLLVLLASGLAYGGIVSGVQPSLTYGAAMVLAGLGMGMAQPCLYEAFGRYDRRWVARAFGIVAAGGMALALGAEVLGPTMLVVANSIFLIGCVILLIACQRKMPMLYGASPAASRDAAVGSGASRRRALVDRFATSGLCVLVVSLLYGALSTTAGQAALPRDTAAMMAQMGGLVTALAFMVYFGTAKREPSTALFNGVFGILGGAVLLLPFLPGGYPALLYALASAAWKLMLLVLFYQVAITAVPDRAVRLAGLALACALPRLGVSAGSFLAYVFHLNGETDAMRLTAVTVALLYLLLMTVWFVNARERRRAEERARAADGIIERYAQRQDDLRALRLDALGEEARLTNREREVLGLLAQGRDLAYICAQLCLSRNTVKGYQKAIYATLGVHSKQELIDLLQDGSSERR